MNGFRRLVVLVQLAPVAPQLVQHPALDAATAGFKEVLDEAGVEVTYDEQNANGEQATALTIAQQFAGKDLDLVLSVATPAAQATAQNITDIPVLFTAVTDPVSAELVDSEEAPGGNVTGTSDVAPIEDQLDLLKELVPDARTVGIVREVPAETPARAAAASPGIKEFHCSEGPSRPSTSNRCAAT